MDKLSDLVANSDWDGIIDLATHQKELQEQTALDTRIATLIETKQWDRLREIIVKYHAIIGSGEAFYKLFQTEEGVDFINTRRYIVSYFYENASLVEAIYNSPFFNIIDPQIKDAIETKLLIHGLQEKPIDWGKAYNIIKRYFQQGRVEELSRILSYELNEIPEGVQAYIQSKIDTFSTNIQKLLQELVFDGLH